MRLRIFSFKIRVGIVNSFLMMCLVLSGCQPLNLFRSHPKQRSIFVNIDEKTICVKIPNLDNTAWKGTDSNGIKYKITFHSSSTYIPSGTGMSFFGGSASIDSEDHKTQNVNFFFTGDSHNLKLFNNCTLSITKKPHKINQKQDAIFNNIRIEFPGPHNSFIAKMEGAVSGDTICLGDVEPQVISIDYKALLGDTFKSMEWYGPWLNIDGQGLAVFMSFSPNAKAAREGLESSKKTLGFQPIPAPADIGDSSYYQGAPWQPLDVSALYFTRKNVFIQIPMTHVVAKSPEVKKRVLEIAYIIDSAIRNESSSVNIIHMPNMFYRER